jgi:hypothetical protein
MIRSLQSLLFLRICSRLCISMGEVSFPNRDTLPAAGKERKKTGDALKLAKKRNALSKGASFTLPL